MRFFGSPAKPYKVQTKCCGFWLTLRRTRTIEGAYRLARELDDMPGVYRVRGRGLTPHTWRVSHSLVVTDAD